MENLIQTLIILKILILFFMCAFIRASYVTDCSNKALIKINKYIRKLKQQGKFNSQINYYQEMKFTYYEFFLMFWLIKDESIIKPQYREILRRY